MQFLVSINEISISLNLTFEPVNPLRKKKKKKLDAAYNWINIHSQVDFYHLHTIISL